MLVAQLGSSSWKAWLLLVAYVLAAAMFGWLSVRLHDVVAGVFCAAALAGAVRMGLVVWRRGRWKSQGAAVVAARSGAVAVPGRVFVGLARHIVGASLQQGMIVIGPTRAAFIPVGRRTHLLVEALLTIFAARFRFVDLEIDVPTVGDVDVALEAVVAKRGGFFIDPAATYAPLQRLLAGPEALDAVWLEQAPPPELTRRWAEARRPSAATVRARRARIIQVSAPIVVAIFTSGAVGFRWTGNPDYLLAGSVWAVLLGGAVTAGIVLSARVLAEGAPR